MAEILWPVGIKKTKQREGVLNILENTSSPLTANDLYNQLNSSTSPIWLSTVYRTLELFVEKGLVIKTSVLEGDMAYYELSRHGHRHYAVCVDCRKIVAINNCPMTEFKPKLSDEEFRVLGHHVEMYGYCRDCDKRNMKEAKGK